MATPQQIASPGVYVTDDIGLEVVDGTASRVQLGLLSNGSYGLQVNGPNLSGAISGSPPSIVTGTAGAQFTDKGIQVSDGSVVRATLGHLASGDYGLQVSGGAISGELGGSPPAVVAANAGTQLTNKGVEVSDGTNVRVTLGQISATPTYGLKVVSSDGTTVIIDGTSDMFKISASGTVQTAAFVRPGTTQASVTLLLGMTYAPSFIYLDQYSTGIGARSGIYFTWDSVMGSATQGQVTASYSLDVQTVSTNQTFVQATTTAAGIFAGTEVARTYRYFILTEVAF